MKINSTRSSTFPETVFIIIVGLFTVGGKILSIK